MHVHLAGNGKPEKKQRDATKIVNAVFSNPFGKWITRNMVEGYAKIALMAALLP